MESNNEKPTVLLVGGHLLIDWQNRKNGMVPVHIPILPDHAFKIGYGQAGTFRFDEDPVNPAFAANPPSGPLYEPDPREQLVLKKEVTFTRDSSAFQSLSSLPEPQNVIPLLGRRVRSASFFGADNCANGGFTHPVDNQDSHLVFDVTAWLYPPQANLTLQIDGQHKNPFNFEDKFNVFALVTAFVPPLGRDSAHQHVHTTGSLNQFLSFNGKPTSMAFFDTTPEVMSEKIERNNLYAPLLNLMRKSFDITRSDIVTGSCDQGNRG